MSPVGAPKRGEFAAAAIVSPSPPRLAAPHDFGLISINATTKTSVDFLAMHWDVAEARARECNKTVSRDKWRLVGLMHIADTNEQTIKDVAQSFATIPSARLRRRRCRPSAKARNISSGRCRQARR